MTAKLPGIRMLVFVASCVVIALYCGVYIGRTFSEKSLKSEEPERGSVRLQAAVGNELSEGSQVQNLAKIVKKQKERIEALESQIAAQKNHQAKAVASFEELNNRAQTFASDFTNMESGLADSGTVLKTLGSLDKLTPNMTEHFANLFDSLLGTNSQKELRHSALRLALLCGGEEGSDFLQELLQGDYETTDAEKQKLYSMLRGDGSLFSIARIAVSDDLQALAYDYLDQSDPAVRAAAAGILGGVKSNQSRTELLDLVFDEQSYLVRSSALQSLGLIGDEKTLQNLKQRYIEIHSLKGSDPKHQRSAEKSLLAAIAALSRKFKK